MRNEADPCSANSKVIILLLTAIVEAAVESRSKLGPHLDDEVPALFKARLAICNGLGNECLEVHPLKREDHIAYPLSIDVDPVSFIWKVLQDSVTPLGELQDVGHGELLNLWNASYKHLVPLYVLWSEVLFL
jgi:hypothetical protein